MAAFARIKVARVPVPAVTDGEFAEVQRALVRAAADTRGAVALEFGFVVIPLVLLLVGIFQIGYAYYVAASLDQASNAGARAIMTGAVSTLGLSASQFTQTYICPQLTSNFNCNSVAINVLTVLKAPLRRPDQDHWGLSRPFIIITSTPRRTACCFPSFRLRRTYFALAPDMTSSCSRFSIPRRYSQRFSGMVTV